MLVLLSPAKTFDQNFVPQVQTCTEPVFVQEANVLTKLLSDYSPEALEKLMKVSPKIADLNFGRFKSWTSKGHYQSLWLFAGDVYRGMGAQDFNNQEVAFAQKHLRILSGLYGCLRPLDKIDPYRLEMGTKLSNPHGKDLYAFWGDKVTKQINSEQPEFLINLASEEYAKILHINILDTKKIDIVFQEQKGDARKIVAIYAKKARGMMARYIIKNQITKIKELSSFSEAGYQFDPEDSSEDRLVFYR